jgi:hypothetical protein
MPSFGGVDPSQIEQLLKEERPSDAAGSAADDRFVQKVTKLVELRQELGEQAGLSIFLRSRAINDDVKHRQKVSLPMVCNGNDPVSQRVVISDALLGKAYSLPIMVDNDVLDSLEQHDLGHHPALVVDWRGNGPKAMFWPKGVSGGEPIDLYLADHEITPDEMKAILDDFYEKRMRTPQRIIEGHGQQVWHKASQGLPADRPEEKIQGILITFLRGRLTHEISPEVNNPSGRLDVEISAKLHDTNGDRIVKKIWVLELKALTDKTTDGGDVAPSATLASLHSGVLQAHSYRDSIHANKAALCCYDMRKTDHGDDIIFDPVRTEANDNKVHLWRWFLHRTAAAGRKASA